MAGDGDEAAANAAGGANAQVGFAVATPVRVKIPAGGSFHLEGGFSLKEGEELLGLVRRVTSKDGSVI